MTRDAGREYCWMVRRQLVTKGAGARGFLHFVVAKFRSSLASRCLPASCILLSQLGSHLSATLFDHFVAGQLRKSRETPGEPRVPAHKMGPTFVSYCWSWGTKAI